MKRSGSRFCEPDYQTDHLKRHGRTHLEPFVANDHGDGNDAPSTRPEFLERESRRMLALEAAREVLARFHDRYELVCATCGTDEVPALAGRRDRRRTSAADQPDGADENGEDADDCQPQPPAGSGRRRLGTSCCEQGIHHDTPGSEEKAEPLINMNRQRPRPNV